MGFEIICAAYNEKLKRKIIREKGIKKINIVSKDQIEMVKHPSKIIYGVQFHPEYFKTKKANKIIKNFLRI